MLYLHAIPGGYILMADTLTVKEHAAETQLHGHVNNVLCSQVVVVVVLLLAIAQKPVIQCRTRFVNALDVNTIAFRRE